MLPGTAVGFNCGKKQAEADISADLHLPSQDSEEPERPIGYKASTREQGRLLGLGDCGQLLW